MNSLHIRVDFGYQQKMPLGWKMDKLESRSLGEISIASDMQMIPPLWKKAKKK